MLFEVECKFNIGDTVKVRHEDELVDASITAIVIEIRGEVNVFYKLHSNEAAIDNTLLIEEYLVMMSEIKSWPY